MLVAAAPALAKPRLVVVPVVPIPGEVELAKAREMTTAMLEELALQGSFDTVEGESAALAGGSGGKAEQGDDKAFAKALAELEEGQKLSARLRARQAIGKLEAGIAGVTKHLEHLSSYDLLINAYVELAANYLRRGQEGQGREALAQVARLKPDHELPADKYPPVFLNIFGEVKAAALERTRGNIEVRSAGDVFINGRRVGRAPVRVEQIIPGDNHVVVKGPEGASSQVVQVEPGKTAQVESGGGGEPTLADAIAANRFDREAQKAARALGQKSGGDWVIVTAIGQGKGVLSVGGFLGNLKNGKWTILEPVAPDTDMLSASIEAHTLARDVASKVAAFKPDVDTRTMPFIAGKPVRDGSQAAGGQMNRVAFVGGVVPVGSADGAAGAVASTEPSRAPIVPGGSRVPVVSRGPATPVASRGPVTPSPAEASPAATSREPVSSRGPLTSRSNRSHEASDAPVEVEIVRGGVSSRESVPASGEGGPRRVAVRSGPEPSADPTEELALEPLTREDLAAGEAAPGAGAGNENNERIIAAVSPDAAGRSVPGLTVTQEDDSVLTKWWFWTAVVGGAAVVGAVVGTSIWAAGQGAPTSVTVKAVW